VTSLLYPSEIVTTDMTEGTDLSAKDSGAKLNSTTHRPGLAKDLQDILLMALQDEPEKRYASVGELSEDIRRYLEGWPVLAGPDSIRYRIGKFVGRNKFSVMATALTVLSLMTGVIFALTQAHRATVQARIANEQRDTAQRAVARAEKTARFLQNFLAYANPNWYARGKGRTDVTVREAIDDAASRIDTDLANEPEVRADIHHTIGEVYRVSDKNELAAHHFRQSLELYRQAYGEEHPKVAMALYYMSIGIGSTGGSFAEAEPLLRQGIAIMRRTDANNVNLPYMLQSLAGWVMSEEKQSKNEKRLLEAEGLILEAKQLFIHHYGENHLATLTAEYSLAQLASARGDLALAESIREAALERFRESDIGDYSHIWALFGLAEIKLARGKEGEAEELFAQSLDFARRRWSSDDTRLITLSQSINQARHDAATAKQ
jgi:serine/threonine-protein kinase